jgi:hypothetical protein
MKHNLPSVKNNQEKYETYKTQMERFNQAKEQGFYLEGIFILYAMLEDRLSSFLFYAGVLNNDRDKLKKNKEVKPYLEEMLASMGNRKYMIKRISNKVSIVQNMFTASQTMFISDSSICYQDVLSAHIKKTKKHEKVFPLLNAISIWCQARNELVHALLAKNVDQQEDKLLTLIEEGFFYCRQLDNFVRAFKRGNTIRKQFNIQ